MIKFKPYQQCSYLYKEDSAVYVSRFSQQFPNLLLYYQKLDSWYSRSEWSAGVLAQWGGANGLDTTSVDLRPGKFYIMIDLVNYWNLFTHDNTVVHTLFRTSLEQLCGQGVN